MVESWWLLFSDTASQPPVSLTGLTLFVTRLFWISELQTEFHLGSDKFTCLWVFIKSVKNSQILWSCPRLLPVCWLCPGPAENWTRESQPSHNHHPFHLASFLCPHSPQFCAMAPNIHDFHLKISWGLLGTLAKKCYSPAFVWKEQSICVACL